LLLLEILPVFLRKSASSGKKTSEKLIVSDSVNTP